MEIKQISVFLQNSPGRLADVTKVLADAGINLRAISVADTHEFGILRIITDNYEKAVIALSEGGFTTRLTNVVVLEIDDTPGSLAKVMELFRASQVNIEYLYASLEGEKGKAVVIFKLEDHEKGLKIIKDNHLPVIESF